jgi:hypothetical protein
MSVQVLESTAVKTENPFPGLRPFEAKESDRFFGREDDIFELLNRLRHMRFLAVVGASGCGKSSLIRAGLIASLTNGALPGEWRVAILRPWQSPVAQLAAALSCEGALDVPASSPDEAAAIVKAILQKGSLGIIETLQRYPLPPDSNLLILVDQFEELFTFMDDPKIKSAQEEARAFVKLLLEVLCLKYKDLRIYVALTMRSDFLGNCALFPGLADAINNGLYLLPQMEREQLRDAIKEPVEAGGGKISERLIDTLINDLRGDTDQLPILQHAMMRLWDQWALDGGEKIGFDQYKKIGELSATLCNHAEEVYGHLDPQRQQPIAEAVFRSITRVKDGKIVRQQTKLGLIRKSPKLRDVGFEEIERVINEFRADGRSFLIPSMKHDLDDETAIDISHESLIRQWERLRDWALNEATHREIHRQISEQALLWSARGRDESFLFWGTRLFEADDWLNKNPDVLNEVENEFLVASQNAHEKEIIEHQKKELSEKVIADGATQVASIEKGSAKVFLAYSRKDRPFAEHLREAFKEVGEETLVDWDILPTKDFEDHVRDAIESADTFVFVISPSSMDSSFCMQELQYATSQNKRIVPVVVRKVEAWKLPEQLREEHWIRFTEKDDFAAAFRTLREAIKSDLVWVRLHTRLLVRATEWDKRERDASLLLRGRDLSEAEQWLGKETLEPALTALQRAYIINSRTNATKRQRWRLSVAFVGLVLLFLTIVTGYAYSVATSESKRAQAESKRAQDQEARAQQAFQIANESAMEARRQAANAQRAAENEKKAREAESALLVRAESEVKKATEARHEAERQRHRAVQMAAEQRKLQEKYSRERELGIKAAKVSGDFFTTISGITNDANPTSTPIPGKSEDEVLLKQFSDLAGIYNKLGYYNAAYSIQYYLQDGLENVEGVSPERVIETLNNYATTLRALGKFKEAAEVERRIRDFRANPRKPPPREIKNK